MLEKMSSIRGMALPLVLACLALPVEARCETQAKAAQPVPPDPKLEVQAIKPGLYVLSGAGGNVAVWSGTDGTVLVDDGLDRFVPALLAAVAEITAEPVRFVINTHWHPDHTAANEPVAKSGGVVIAHDNVRRRMSTRQFMEALQREVPPSPTGALPIVTFDDTVSLHLNGDRLDAGHVLRAHTDGDVILRWENANVIHAGDVWFNGSYPFVDLSSGGSLAGLVAAVEFILDRADADTIIIAGHGPAVGRRDELAAYRDMLVDVGRRVRELVEQGRGIDEILAAQVTAPYDARYGNSSFMPPEKFVRILYEDLQRAGRP
jgi:glyoxylase-like metal-dependent hydrolase (beta-lactamase superfamily II)